MIDYKHLSRHSKPVLLDDDDSPSLAQEVWFFIACLACLAPCVYSVMVVLGVIA